MTPAGFEPATCPLGGGCSIQLSHGASSCFMRYSSSRLQGPNGWDAEWEAKTGDRNAQKKKKTGPKLRILSLIGFANLAHSITTGPDKNAGVCRTVWTTARLPASASLCCHTSPRVAIPPVDRGQNLGRCISHGADDLPFIGGDGLNRQA